MADRKRDAYRVVAVSLYQQEATEADRLAEILKRVGWPKANRSLIVREALRLLEEELAGKDDERVFRYFVERYARRLGGSGTRTRRPDITNERPTDGPEHSTGTITPAEASDDSRRKQ